MRKFAAARFDFDGFATLGITHEYPAGALARAVQFYAKSHAMIGGRDRVAGLTLRATDTDLSVASGPLVEGAVMSLLLAASVGPAPWTS